MSKPLTDAEVDAFLAQHEPDPVRAQRVREIYERKQRQNAIRKRINARLRYRRAKRLGKVAH